MTEVRHYKQPAEHFEALPRVGELHFEGDTGYTCIAREIQSGGEFLDVKVTFAVGRERQRMEATTADNDESNHFHKDDKAVPIHNA